MKKVFLICLMVAIISPHLFSQTITFIKAGSSWKYLDNGSDQGALWSQPSFNDSSWSAGNAQLGYGDGDETTVVGFGPNPGSKYITTYFRKSFNVANPAIFSDLKVHLRRDDGAVVYLNGTEVVRNNISAGTVPYTKLAVNMVNGTGETTWRKFTVDSSLLLAGTNIIAVEVHQHSATSDDLTFDLKLQAMYTAGCDIPTGATAVSITASSAVFQWNAVAGASKYTLRYRQSGSVPWITLYPVSNSRSVTTLTSSTAYEWQVRAVCQGVPGAFTAITNFSTWPDCQTPGGLSAVSITSNSAVLNWAQVPGATGYSVRLRKTGTATWSIHNIPLSPFSATGLTSASGYEWQVQAFCNAAQGAFSGLSFFTTAVAPLDSLILAGGSWKYLDNGSSQGTAWRANGFNDSSWPSGNAELGYGDGDEATTVSYGGNSSAKHVTTYFRKSFTVQDPSIYAWMGFRAVRDDGIIIYLNGTELYRNNMPGGNISNTTHASNSIGGADESAWISATLDVSALLSGSNVLAVEIHQHSASSSDISFKLGLAASGQPPPPSLVRGPYLQKLSANGITIRWRTDVACNSKVEYGSTTSYGSVVTDQSAVTEHSVSLTGLSTASKYYYSIGTTYAVIQGDSNNTFNTAPVMGTSSPVRIWVTGDFGNGSNSQQQVRNAYMNYPGAHGTNLWIWLGDNAYATGTDAEYQANVFNIYPLQFRKFPLFPGIGNHDYGNYGYQGPVAMGTSSPYFSIFTVPQAGECGGVQSGTPKYYSFNYANIHFISLDSYGALNTPGSPMYQWLADDLAANQQRWTIAYWHHPPYTKGTHNSDTDNELISMRTNIVPLLESHRVDLVLCGHSHVNERSYLIKGHYGSSGTFNASMKISPSGNSFIKSAPFDGTVYAVCGTSGQNPGTIQNGAPMPCMHFMNNTNNCSMVIDINGDDLEAKFLTSNGTIADQFTIAKTGMRPVAGESTEGPHAFYNAEEKTIYVDYHVKQTCAVEIDLMNLLGEKIGVPAILKANQAPGTYRQEIPLDAVSVSDGIYFIRIKFNSNVKLVKVFVTG